MSEATSPPGDAQRSAELRFLRRVLIVAAVVVLALALWRLVHAVLLVFAAVLVAVLLRGLAKFAQRYLPLNDRWALGLMGGGLVLIVVLVGWLIGGQVQAQVSQLAGRLPQAVQSLEQRLGTSLPLPAILAPGAAQRSPGGTEGDAGSMMEQVARNPGQSASIVANMLGGVARFGAVLLDGLAGLVLALLGGVYLAAEPGLYRRGLVKLFPPSQHGRVEGTLRTSGEALWLWLGGQLISMILVGMLIGLGAWLIGLPAPLALGLFAGITEFVPIIGPWLGAVPGLLLALSQGTDALLWTMGLYLIVQQAESNLIAPLVQQRMVDLPPAVLLFSVVVTGALFGPLGVALAGPLTVVAYVAVKKLYVRETLGEATPVPGEHR